jgi:hypothetical protein
MFESVELRGFFFARESISLFWELSDILSKIPDNSLH